MSALRSTLHVKMIALESAHVANMSRFLVNALPAFVQDLTGLKKISEDNQHNPHAKEILSVRSRAISKAKSLDFMTFGENWTSVPQGFKGNLYDYGQTLYNSLYLADQRVNSMLLDINTYLASFITNREIQLSTKDHTQRFELANKERMAISDNMAKFFGSNVSKMPINQVMERFGDLEKLGDQVKNLDTLLSKFQIAAINSKVNETVTLADLILKNLKNKQIDAVGPFAARAISDGLFQTALYMELVSTLYYDTTVYLKCINELFKTFAEV